MSKKIMICFIIIFIFLILMIMSFNKKQNKDCIPEELHDKVILDSIYSNYAWGFIYYGKFVLGNGNIYSVELKESDKNDSLSQFRLNSDFLINHKGKKVGKISQKDLNQLYKYLIHFKNDYTNIKNTAQDAGSYIISYYNYDDNQKYIITETGDNEFKNKNKNTEKIIKILKKYDL